MKTNFLSPLIDLFFHPSCLVCDRNIPIGSVCTDCLPPPSISSDGRCVRCFSPVPDYFRYRECTVCLHMPLAVDRIRYLWPYETVRHLIATTKYKPSFHLATWLADRFISCENTLLPIPSDIVITPIPSQTKQLQSRLFSLTHMLARKLHKTLRSSAVFEPYLLQQKREHVPQASLRVKDRISNIRDAFQVNSSLNDIHKILLIEDVITTGATITEAALALKSAGAHSVEVLALARSDRWEQARQRIADRVSRYESSSKIR